MASFSMLINGSFSSHFCSMRHLTRGSPLLFLLVVEVLGCMLDRVVEVGMLEGFQVGPNEVAVSHKSK